ncbi:MAG: V-type ATP synthase subunit B [Defluviitaleaceae bacterium]|nr:V-type ATP synthase subunit B [Defluviitaleaceae bacterium]
MEYQGLRESRSNLIVIEGVTNAAYDEIVAITTENEPPRMGRVIQVDGDNAVVLVFEGTRNLTLDGTRVRFTGKQLEIKLSEEILGRVFDGLARPRDGLGEIYATQKRIIAGEAINPAHRIYPRNYIPTGFSAIDGLITLIRGQKLPIFSAYGLPHDKLAAQIATSAASAASEAAKSHFADDLQTRHEAISSFQGSKKFAVVFAAMGVQHDTAQFFRDTLIESGQFERMVMFLNLANDPPTERVATPRFALTAAEYLAYDLHYHVLVILTDMTAYCEAIREISSARGEIPARKGFPGYMYSDLASIYERAGIRKGSHGSVTQIPILTMPGEDITHPIPDLTGYITEGQIVLDRALHQKGIFPPINVLPSLSRLMKDGIGEGFTTKEHPNIAAKLFASYAGVSDIRSLATVIGEEDLTEQDKNLLDFGRKFEEQFLHQGHENRPLSKTLEIAEELLIQHFP